MRSFAKRILPAWARAPMRRAWWRVTRRPAPKALAGMKPVSPYWGLDRGTPLDVYYIERFIASNARDIRGRVLEVGDARYTQKFGGNRVTRSDVLHYGPGNPRATIVGDLATGEGIPKGAFDCLIVTNTLRLVYDVSGAIATCHGALRPGGVLLAHFTGISPNSIPDDAGPPGWFGEGEDHWRLTGAAARRLCAGPFGAEHISVESYGNLRTATAFLYGLASEDLTVEELDHRDPRYDVIVCARASKVS